jgi:hypothetical protein
MRNKFLPWSHLVYNDFYCLQYPCMVQILIFREKSERMRNSASTGAAWFTHDPAPLLLAFYTNCLSMVVSAIVTRKVSLSASEGEVSNFRSLASSVSRSLLHHRLIVRSRLPQRQTIPSLVL